MLIPRKPIPDLRVPTLDGDTWILHEQTPPNFVLLAFYRGFHCPICKRYLADLHRRISDFEQRGVSVLALSSDSRDRAVRTRQEWELPDLPIGYGLSVEQARAWGLFISTSRGKTSMGVVEPDVFSEPGLFLIRPDMTLYAAIVQTMPFARPHFAEVLASLDFILEHDYPARGEA
ncbi:MAG: peroxiredoxin-like family protein [Rhodothermales bacterium]